MQMLPNVSFIYHLPDPCRIKILQNVLHLDFIPLWCLMIFHRYCNLVFVSAADSIPFSGIALKCLMNSLKCKLNIYGGEKDDGNSRIKGFSTAKNRKRTVPHKLRQNRENSGPEGIWTLDLRIKSPSLFRTKLQARDLTYTIGCASLINLSSSHDFLPGSGNGACNVFRNPGGTHKIVTIISCRVYI